MERNKDNFGLVANYVIWGVLISIWTYLFLLLPAYVVCYKFFN